MSTMPTTSRAAIAVAIAGLTASLFTGCFGNPADLVNQGVEDADRERHRRRRQPRRRTARRLPRRSIPLIDGDITFSAGAGGAEGWVVILTSSAADPVAEAAAALEGAGFTEDTQVAAGEA